MKLFKSSDKKVGQPAKVKSLKPRLGYWLNVYDPADSFSFLVNPVFDGVDQDVKFSTGVSAFKAHTEYFGRASFFELLRAHIEKALL